jgi:hypothetical protein
MLIKTTIALAMALALGLSSAALAARSGGSGRGGFRELGNGQPASSGVNPAEHRALAAPKQPLLMSNGQCWAVDKGKIGGWSACK